MKRLELSEYGALEAADLSLAEVVALAATRAVEVAPSLEPGRWKLRAAQRVGVVQVGATELWVHPKVPVNRLLYLLGYARDQRGWRDDDPGFQSMAGLVPAMAVSFAALAQRALAQGVLQGYQEEEQSLLVLRGRLREGDQVRRRPGLALPLEVRYDDFTVDIAENRLLLSAARRLLRLPGVPSRVRAALLHLTTRLADVTALTPGDTLPAVRRSRLNDRYQPALRLAGLILQGHSIEMVVGGVRASGFLFDMNRIFEDFLTAVLREELAAHGGVVRGQFRAALDEAGQVPIRPDITWWQGGRCLAVVDAKYKALRPTEFPNTDLYQMLAYCKVLKLPRGHLVYAAGNEQPRTHAIRNADVEVVVHALDLAKEPSALAHDVRQLANEIALAGLDPFGRRCPLSRVAPRPVATPPHTPASDPAAPACTHR